MYLSLGVGHNNYFLQLIKVYSYELHACISNLHGHRPVSSNRLDIAGCICRCLDSQLQTLSDFSLSHCLSFLFVSEMRSLNSPRRSAYNPFSRNLSNNLVAFYQNIFEISSQCVYRSRLDLVRKCVTTNLMKVAQHTS